MRNQSDVNGRTYYTEEHVWIGLQTYLSRVKSNVHHSFQLTTFGVTTKTPLPTTTTMPSKSSKRSGRKQSRTAMDINDDATRAKVMTPLVN